MSKLAEILRPLFAEHPDEMFVTDEFIAVMIPDTEQILVIPGDHRGITAEEANRKLQDILAQI